MPLNYILFIAFNIVLVFLLISLLQYILQAIGLYKMAKNRGMPDAYMAWIPLLNVYLLGNIACPMNFSGKRRNKFGMVLLPLKITSSLFGLISLVMCFAVLSPVIDICLYHGKLYLPMSPATGLTLCFCVFAWLLFRILYLVFSYIAFYHIFSHYDKNNRVLYLVLTIIISGIAPIFIFILGNKKFVNHYENNINQNINNYN